MNIEFMQRYYADVSQNFVKECAMQLLDKFSTPS